jgi:peptidoglycan hydrolase-like protein with peptidoglycan-binding domain
VGSGVGSIVGEITPNGTSPNNALNTTGTAIAPSPAVAVATSAGTVVITQQAVQVRLAQFGFLAATQVNGRDDQVTRDALATFQQSVGLTPTGTLDALTVTALQQGFLTVSPGIPTVIAPQVPTVIIP